MSTPIFDQVKSDFLDAIKSAEARATIEIKSKVLDVLEKQKRPTVEVKKLIEELKDGND